MTCDTCARLLDDLGDGALPPEAVAAVRRHLSACPECRALAADVATIRSLARSLPCYEPPPRVWSALSEKTQPASGRPWLAGLFVIWRPALAAAMSVVLLSALTWLGGRLTAVTTPHATDAAATLPGFAHRAAEMSYTHAIASLEELAHARRDALEPAIADVLDSGMVVVDTAIDQSRAALRTAPNSEVAQESLLRALQMKVVLLQDTLALATTEAAAIRETTATGQAEATP